MAWVTEYDLQWISQTTTGKIYLQRDGGSYQQPLLLKRESLEVRASLPSWEDHIVQRNCSFTVVNNFSDFYELLPLMTISNGQIRVIIDYDLPSPLSEADLFEGYLNCEMINQEMLHKSDITFTASGLLNKLKYEHPTSVDTLQTISLIDMIIDCLTMTGSDNAVYVHCSLYELNHALASNQTVFNRTALFTEIMWKNNIERVSAYDILNMILRSFNCYLYWFSGRWYIEHYEDLGSAVLESDHKKAYVQYLTSGSYGYSSTGVLYDIEIGEPYNIHEPTLRPQEGNTQVLSISPGMRQIEVKLNQKQFLNLVNGDLTNTTTTSDSQPIPGWREWEAYDTIPVEWYSFGERWRNIANSTYRAGYDVTSGSDYGNGLTTSFKLSIKEDTQFTMRWKYGVSSEGVPIPGSSPLEDYTVTFTYWMYLYNINTTVGSFVIYNESAQTWEYAVGGTPLTSLITVDVNGSEFDADLLTTEVSVTIPLGQIYYESSGSDLDDFFVQFCIGTEQWADGIITPVPSSQCYWGDPYASISETADNNLIRGELNTDFLDEKTVTLDLFDAGWSYRNTLLTGTNDAERAKDWGYDSISDTLARWILSSKFRLNNVARQTITTNVKYIGDVTLGDPPGYFRPLQVWVDNKQSDKPFVLTEDTHYPETDMHRIVLREYDDSTTINLI